MELANTWQSIADNGIMFWAATGAVALGIALTLASGLIQVRRLRSRTDLPVAAVPSEHPEPAAQIDEIPLDREMKVKSQNDQVGPEPTSSEQISRELGLVRARLRSIADRLEDFQRTRRHRPLDRSESSLKDSHDGVDYLFRTGTG